MPNDPIQQNTMFTKSVTLAGGLQEDVPEFLQEVPTSAYVENARFYKKDELWKALPEELVGSVIADAKFLCRTKDGFAVGHPGGIVEYDPEGNQLASADTFFATVEKVCNSAVLAGACNFTWAYEAKDGEDIRIVLAYESRSGHTYDPASDSRVYVERYTEDGRFVDGWDELGACPTANQNNDGEVLIHFSKVDILHVREASAGSSTATGIAVSIDNRVAEVQFDALSNLPANNKGYNSLRNGLQQVGANPNFQVHYPGKFFGIGHLLFVDDAGDLRYVSLTSQGLPAGTPQLRENGNPEKAVFAHDVRLTINNGVYYVWLLYSVWYSPQSDGNSLYCDVAPVGSAFVSSTIWASEERSILDASLAAMPLIQPNDPTLLLTVTYTDRRQTVNSLGDDQVTTGTVMETGLLERVGTFLQYNVWDRTLDHIHVSNPVFVESDGTQSEALVMAQQCFIEAPYVVAANAQNERANPPLPGLKPTTTYLLRIQSNGFVRPVAGLDVNASKQNPITMQEQVVRTGKLSFTRTDINKLLFFNRFLLQAEDMVDNMLVANATDQDPTPAWDKILLTAGEFKGNLYEVDLSADDVRGYPFGGGVFIDSSIPMFFAQGSLYEAGVLEQPEIITAVSPSSNVNTRKYAYGVQYDNDPVLWTTLQVIVGFIDNLGFVHRSAPSIPLHVRGLSTIEAAGTTRIVRFTQPLPVADVDWFVEVYEAPYGDVPQLAYSKAINPRSGNRNLITMSYEGLTKYGGTYANPLRSSEFIYTTNFIAADPWEEFEFLVSTSRRIFFSRGSTLYYTKLFEENTAPERNAVLNIPFGRNKKITALGSIDDKIIVFEPDKIHVVYGDGPDNAGEGSSFVVDQLTTTVGCETPTSLLELPFGLIFYSSATQEFHLLDREWNIQNLGSPVQDLSENIEINAAVVYSAENEARWYVTPAPQLQFGPAPDTSSGVPERPPRPRFRNTLPNGPVLVYNFEFGKWCVLSDRQAISADIIDNKVYRLTDSDSVYRISDNWAGAPAFSLRTPWIRIADMQNHGRIDKGIFLGKYFSAWNDYGDGFEAGDIKITTRYNYEANGNYHEYRWRANKELKASNGERLQFSFKPGQPKCQAIQVLVEEVETEKLDDNEPDYTLGRGFALTTLDLKCKLKRGFGDRSLDQDRSK